MRLLGFLWLVTALTVVIHIDWHFALPSHHPFSLAWPQHWILPALAFFAVGAIIARLWPQRPERIALYAALAAIVLAQGMLPMLEVAVIERRLGYPGDPLRWSGFFLCIGIGLPALFSAAWLFRPRHRGRSPSAA